LAPAQYNKSFEEFGVKKYAAISSMGNPSGSAPPGTLGQQLLPSCTIHYATNTDHYVTMSIPDLHLNGDPLNPKFIAATNLQIQNTHSLALGSSDVSSPTQFQGANLPLYVWGESSLPGTPLSAPLHGTETSGPFYTNYNGALVPPFELTVVDWWINVPAGVSQGTYQATITLTIKDTL
jgi:hypothetical protein